MIRCLSVVGVAVALFAHGADAAMANTVVERDVSVSYGDLNLGTVDGQSAMRLRLSSAASQACGGNPVFHSHYRDAALFVRADFEKCRNAAQEHAIAELQARGIRFAVGR